MMFPDFKAREKSPAISPFAAAVFEFRIRFLDLSFPFTQTYHVKSSAIDPDSICYVVY